MTLLGLAIATAVACDNVTPAMVGCSRSAGCAGELDRYFPHFTEPDPTTFIAVDRALREYFHYRKRAVITGSADSLWLRYPALASGADLAHGVNAEGQRAEGLRGIHAIDGDVSIEGHERFRVLVAGDTIHVAVHGWEGYLWPDFNVTGEEILLELSLVRRGDGLTVVRTDAVTEAERHTTRKS